MQVRFFSDQDLQQGTWKFNKIDRFELLSLEINLILQCPSFIYFSSRGLLLTRVWHSFKICSAVLRVEDEIKPCDYPQYPPDPYKLGSDSISRLLKKDPPPPEQCHERHRAHRCGSHKNVCDTKNGC